MRRRRITTVVALAWISGHVVGDVDRAEDGKGGGGVRFGDAPESAWSREAVGGPPVFEKRLLRSCG